MKSEIIEVETTHVDRAISLHPIDVGYDLRTSGIAARLTDREISDEELQSWGVLYEQGGKIYLVTGDRDGVCLALGRAGYLVCAGRQPNGREIRVRRDATGFETQPHSDNYWIPVPTIAAARLAYEHGPDWESLSQDEHPGQ